MKITRLLSLGLAILLGLAACGGGGSGKDKGEVSLRMTIWTNNADHLKLFNGIADEYRRTHPNVASIRFDPLPVETYSTALTTQIAGGNPPDLAWILENTAPDFVASHALLPLDDKLKKYPGYQYGDLAAGPTRLWRQDGSLYAYPFSTSPFGVFVNTDLLKKAGQKPPAAGWTWDQAIASASAVHQRTGKAGLVVRDFDYKAWDNLATVWGGWGAEAWSEDGKTCGFTKPQMVQAMTFLHKAIFDQKAMPGPGTSPDFFAGDAAMTITQISRAALLKGAKFHWDLVPLPAGPNGAYNVIGQGGLGVLKNGKHADAAADFLAFFTDPANSAKLAQYFPPPRTSLLTADALAKSNPLLKPDQLQKVVLDGIANGRVKPNHTGEAEIAQTVRAALDPLWRPGADVPKVMASVCGSVQPLLAK
ncbi:ABC transporter substrate-binding protein [Actinoallomurus iriomotensis]|uniref:Sugar ABC transporter substrate-binding protein n=1 Tax=Actinoallomurus iriomotensis TaxID=478107 RepID=A0A9W6RFT7_9ACTN|nr:sugar ABC transporter substrate-binding protein [Actinoallomurus iriomotensis]GLY73830.1 sugar ABC transporter substrate-binding protein [Actinoallomurus iriomotensis]